MAEKTKDVQNLWLLAIAIVLGLLAVVIYNMHISAIRNENQTRMLKVITVTQDIRSGLRLKRSFLSEEEIIRDEGGAWKKYVPFSRYDALIVNGGKKVWVSLQKDEYLMERHLTPPDRAAIAAVLRPGMVGKTITVSSDESPGDH